jgi:hypothetical protein
MPLPLYPRGKSPRYQLYRRLGGPQNRFGWYGEVTILDPTRTRTPTRQSSSLYPVAIPTVLPTQAGHMVRSPCREMRRANFRSEFFFFRFRVSDSKKVYCSKSRKYYLKKLRQSNSFSIEPDDSTLLIQKRVRGHYTEPVLSSFRSSKWLIS